MTRHSVFLSGGKVKIAVPGAPLIISALTTSFWGMGTISDGPLVVVGVVGVASVERHRTANEERRRVGLVRAPGLQARRRDNNDIGLVVS